MPHPQCPPHRLQSLLVTLCPRRGSAQRNPGVGMARQAVRLPWRFHSINSMFGHQPLRAPCVLGGRSCRVCLQPEFRPHAPIPILSPRPPRHLPLKTSSAIRACSCTKSCAEPPTGNDSKNNLAATSGISLDSDAVLRQSFRDRPKCTLHQYSVFSATFNPRPSTIRTTHAFGCSATILSFPSLIPLILQSPPELSTFFRLSG